MTSTGKKARKRYGTRFAAKQRREPGSSKRKGRRRTFGKLPFSVSAGNAPQGAVTANEALTGRIADERRRNGWEPDANVAVPGPTRDAVMTRRQAEEKLRPRPKRRREEEDFDGE